jgi:hypothetical protein
MTSKKRKYGDLSARPLPSEDESLLDDVFAAFTGRPPISPADIATQADFASPETVASQANQGEDARQIASQAIPAAPANSAAEIASPAPDLLASLPAVKGYLRLYYQLVDHLMPQLAPADAVVYLHLYRLSWGFGKSTCLISNPGLARRACISERSVRDVTTRLISKQLIEKLGVVTGSGKEQGIEYRVAIPAGLAEFAGAAGIATNKEKDLKENTQTQGPPAAGVRVGSRFTIEECRRYANHLRSTGQGINNPGGYATTIHRTGEADELIERFLSPSQASVQTDTSNCPDCQGTGFYYPKGIDQGVAKCPHSRLTT